MKKTIYLIVITFFRLFALSQVSHSFDLSIESPCADLKLEELTKKSFFYPNPAEGQIFLNNIEAESNVCIYNLDGQLLLTKKADFQNKTIDLLGLSRGMYFITVSKSDELWKSKLILR